MILKSFVLICDFFFHFLLLYCDLLYVLPTFLRSSPSHKKCALRQYYSLQYLCNVYLGLASCFCNKHITYQIAGELQKEKKNHTSHQTVWLKEYGELQLFSIAFSKINIVLILISNYTIFTSFISNCRECFFRTRS